ncbi:MAG: hypothetical protein P8Z79_21095 [Sedimentisphaerales bacterium]
MTFTEWIFLLGGLAVAGPLISRRKLRDLLILLLRCTIIVLIALLFARPILHIRHKPEQTKHTYCLGLDNSMSMAYADGGGTFFDGLADSAVDYIRSAEPDSLFNICALASGDWMQGLSKEEALAEVKTLRIEPASANVGDFLSGLGRNNRARDPDNETSVLVLSDFTPNTFDQFVQVAEPIAVDEIDYKPTLPSKPVNNAAIVEAHVESAAENILTVSAVVANCGRTTQNRQLTAKTGSNESAPVDVSLLENQRGTYQVRLDISAAGGETTFWPVELSLSEGDGLRVDDTFYLAVSIPGHKNVNVLLAGDSEYQMFLLKTAIDTLSRTKSYNTLSLRQVLVGNLGPSDLDWADVVICSAITDRLGYLASNLKDFVSGGGKLIFFVNGSVAPEATKQLWRQGVLAALPGEYARGLTYIQPEPWDNQASGVDHAAEKSLSNYRIDKILLKGYLECEPHAESRCLWQLRNGSGFVYLKTFGAGCSILVNTSADDSLGTLTKANASVAFCQYLLGQDNQIGEHCSASDERVTLPVPDKPASSGTQQEFWIETCDGKKRRAAVADSLLLVPDPAGIGWVKTLGKPTLYAGINLPQGETDMTPPSAAELDEVMKQVFVTDSDGSVSSADVLGDKKPKPIWKIVAWTIIGLLLVEPAVANRLRR